MFFTDATALTPPPKVRRLKTQLADEQMRSATAAEENVALRSQLTK